ncbi:MAG TPA: hypothetical protein VLL97_06485 [Acidobacteriota bacterium]|nr:hypothetical protein [Acidobacteriota bacterium]
MRMVKLSVFIVIIVLCHTVLPAQDRQNQDDEFLICRLLSISESEKLILVSHGNEKTKYLLDAANANITMNGKPAKFNELNRFSTIKVNIKLQPSRRRGVTIDGLAMEIIIPDK